MGAPAAPLPGAATWAGCPGRCWTGSTSKPPWTRRTPAEPRRLPSRAESSVAVAVRVLAARDRAARRLAATPWQVNAQVPAAELRRHWTPPPDALRGIERAAELGQISDRGVAKIIRVAWTIADLAGRPRPTKDECHAALGLWLGLAR